ncbi:MAG: hypothetical protein XU11_C0028G0012 [Candidatus Dadabacteria bacterium CSP1-2]|jgi:hypothetical protein|nr:MAG: hypothetical protein XU11_C0028G0012 [Candidatus Dadabacteria bacterium CSP1-2]
MPQHLSSDIHPVVKGKFIYAKPKISDKDPSLTRASLKHTNMAS